MADEEISAGQALISVPSSLIMTKETCKASKASMAYGHLVTKGGLSEFQVCVEGIRPSRCVGGSKDGAYVVQVVADVGAAAVLAR